MFRASNTRTTGAAFDAAMISAVWHKAQPVPGWDASQYRQDACGAWIAWSAYGTTGAFGWEIDHILPISRGGIDTLSNLQPLQWENNRHKCDFYPYWTCKVPAA